MTYSPTTWVNGSTAVSQAVMNNIEQGIVNALCNDGTVPIVVTMSGANKTLLTFEATDGKTYALIMRHTDNKLVLFNNTDGVNVAEFGPLAGELTLNGAAIVTDGPNNAASGLTLSAGNGAPGSLQQNEIYIQLT